MQKEFTVNIPDELWVDSWEDELTATYTYEGPRYFYAGLDSGLAVHELRYGDLESEAEAFTEEESNKYAFTVIIDADVNPELAHMIYVHDHEDHVFEDIANHDGSIYKKITNPCLKDIYSLEWRMTNTADAAEAYLEPIYKNTELVLHKIAKSRLNILKKYDNAYDFDTEDQAKVDAAIATFNTYLESIATAYPWKYISVDETEIPKIPASLQLLFNQLPELD